MSPVPAHRALLAAAVEAIGGSPRPGQLEMADAVDRAMDEGIHLLVQAGTGTGKSLGYLAPALARAVDHDTRVIVATATLALQAQLAHKDIPAALKAAAATLKRTPRTAVLKGRSNHACLYRVRDGVRPDQDALLTGGQLTADQSAAGDPDSRLGAEVVMLREWAEDQADRGLLGDRDDAPDHSPRAWSQVSVPARECLGTRCPFAEECLFEVARQKAREADLVVTNHALLAIDALNDGNVLPEHEVVIIDEAHEVVDRFTGAASALLTPTLVTAVAKRAASWLDDNLAADLLDQADTLHEALEATEPGRVTDPGASLIVAAQSLRDLSRSAVSALGRRDEGEEAGADAERTQAQGAMREVFEVAERIAALATADVVWISESEYTGRAAQVAPLKVAGLLRANVLSSATTILTSATLKIGGEFTSAARDVGLQPGERVDDTPEVLDTEMAWRGVDVGSPFDYRSQGILYVGRDLPRPRRDGIAEEVLDDLAELVWAAGGRTLGLFASQRNAVRAAEHLRHALPKVPVLCQGEGHLAGLTRQFIDDPATCLFGTLSLWQGVDVPGDTCRLVVIDKIPFPRPDDPLTQARSQAVQEAGGNGFMTVSAGHAALLLAQGSGRLIRRADDKGVVAVLDPRLVTARYGSFLRASMPGFWTTTDREVAIGALKRLS
ncbi:ATP-dependent DNA helicase [Acidipropionibacterium jensenii]|uniref:ATP-dependent helicase DinG n=2 Tax=Acidipropionibacterium jensenii TaxID=1749 RepID=A0A3T0RZN1_9ACTN|nr:ATP-dependent DNA helicase [Acidipropionibacterium jensenii]AZZ39568.1 ATP-dependent DNA helicase [Acidipropionibacterium jensenii]